MSPCRPSTSASTSNSNDSGFESPGNPDSRLFVLPALDNALLNDERVFLNLVRADDARRPTDLLFQKDLTPQFRATLVTWMADVCKEENADLEVFPLAVSILDRFLSTQQVYLKTLQAAGAACLFLASKVKQTVPFRATKLVELTDDSVKLGELMSWELLVLSRLGWDVAAATGMDFCELLLRRLPFPASLIARIRPAAFQVLEKLLTDMSLSRVGAPLQGAMCIVSASLRVLAEQEAVPTFLTSLSNDLNIPMEDLESAVSRLEAFLESEEGEPEMAEIAYEYEKEDTGTVTPSETLPTSSDTHPLQGPPLYFCA